MPASSLIFLLFCLLAQASRAAEIRLVHVGERWRYFGGNTEPASDGSDWRELEYNDSAWVEAAGGFSTPQGYTERTLLSNYGVTYTTVYFRRKFGVRDTNQIGQLILRIDYDDGFVAYLNGVEVLRRNIAGNLGEVVPANSFASAHKHGVTEEVDISAAGIPALRNGTNVLTIQLLGSSSNDFTATMVAELLANFTRGPFIQNSTAHSTQIAWKTQSPAAGFVDFGRDIGNTTRIEAEDTGTNHLATLTNLLAGTQYTYRIGTKGGTRDFTSEWAQFTTFRESGDLEFEVVGDTGWSSKGQFDIASEMQKAGGDLIVHVGDLAYYAITPQVADFRFFSVYAEQMRSVPLFLAFGNHEMYLDRRAAIDSLYLPTNNATGTEMFYSFDHGDAHFAILWTDLQSGADYSPGSAQYEWLDHDLATSDKPWKFLFFHQVWRSSSIHDLDDYDYDNTQDKIQIENGPIALARKHGVQLIFNGHDHGYQRFVPGNGPVSFVTGGGGAALYALISPDSDMVHYWARYNFLKLSVRGEETSIRAIGDDGTVFDSLTVRRALPERRLYHSTWNTVPISSGPADDGDGNIAGQKFAFEGSGIAPLPGAFTSAGRLHLNNDNTNLYIGIDQAMLLSGDELFAFVEAPGSSGVTSLRGMGNGILDPSGEAVDALDFLSNLSFTNFAPGIGVILGDEFADSPSRTFARPGQPAATGQGAFWLTNGLPEVAGQALTQFNLSPQQGPIHYEQNADFIELALPLSSIGARPGDVIKIGTIVARGPLNTNDAAPNYESREIDSGGIGYSLLRDGAGTYLEGIEIRLATADDGFRVSIRAAGAGEFEVLWEAEPGTAYVVEWSSKIDGPFASVNEMEFPRMAASEQESYIVKNGLEADSRTRFYRVTRIEP